MNVLKKAALETAAAMAIIIPTMLLAFWSIIAAVEFNLMFGLIVVTPMMVILFSIVCILIFSSDWWTHES